MSSPVLSAAEQAATPLHGSEGRLTSIVAWLEAIADRANPILVKETRQALKSRQFVLTFLVVLIACWIASFAVVAIATWCREQLGESIPAFYADQRASDQVPPTSAPVRYVRPSGSTQSSGKAGEIPRDTFVAAYTAIQL